MQSWVWFMCWFVCCEAHTGVLCYRVLKWFMWAVLVCLFRSGQRQATREYKPTGRSGWRFHLFHIDQCNQCEYEKKRKRQATLLALSGWRFPPKMIQPIIQENVMKRHMKKRERYRPPGNTNLLADWDEDSLAQKWISAASVWYISQRVTQMQPVLICFISNNLSWGDTWKSRGDRPLAKGFSESELNFFFYQHLFWMSWIGKYNTNYLMPITNGIVGWRS